MLIQIVSTTRKNEPIAIRSCLTDSLMTYIILRNDMAAWILRYYTFDFKIQSVKGFSHNYS